MTPACQHCKFFAVDIGARAAGKAGQCRYNPPAVMLAPIKTLAGDTVAPLSVWPGVEGTSWCGQYSE